TNDLDVFLRCMDGLSLALGCKLVHYKEAVHECQSSQCMRLFTTYWELEETNRLQTFLASLYAEADTDFHTADREASMLLKALITKQSLSHPAAELEFLGEIRQRDKMSLRETDSRLDLLGDYVKQRQETWSLDDMLGCAGGNLHFLVLLQNSSFLEKFVSVIRCLFGRLTRSLIFWEIMSSRGRRLGAWMIC
ncbi:hypothetical protein P692DRAFT_20751862, partial [Suillus brevipes Sb2]